MSPRPILKRSAPAYGTHSGSQHAVHFPPSPSLTTHTFSVYSAAAYDRSPIVVSPNTCALPERGCPGRTYNLEEQTSPTLKRRHPSRGRDLHPRALACSPTFQQREDVERASSSCSLPPPLIPDLSSESDESDGFSSPPTDPYTPSTHVHGLTVSEDHHSTYTSFDVNPYATPMSPAALSFLPHPPSSRSRSPYAHDMSAFDEPPMAKPKRRRERKHDPSRVPDRIPDAPGSPETTPTKKSSRVAAFSKSLAVRRAVSAFRIEDDGCLGGF
ncbi:hypothetical protein LshimejAT787_1600930 [Lyophyllum shimeji]|uniref:Uncharacterized protein n=1 Tax=Lyophyllum shimeji TaxID=47721 RepID=A0A9P3PZ16_LYOSH|nr:hypothetical protein LshimejAT787_1600930 [Lyophyllum shimeji]